MQDCVETKPSQLTNTAFLGRQPIFLPNLEVYGYELLFRSATDQNSATIENGDLATASVVLNSVTELGLDVVAGSKVAFINMTRSLLLHADLSCLPADRVVLEVLENITPDDDVLNALNGLAANGYTIALDDFIYRPGLKPLLEVAHVVKLELPQIPRNELADHVARLRELGVKTILAEKVETHEEYELCKQLGCDLFQGYFFCRPQVFRFRKLKCNPSVLLGLISKLLDPNISNAALVELIQTDASLCYKVLRFANSATFYRDTEIESIGQATSLLGLRRLRSLVSMMLLASIDEDKPAELINSAMLRAKTCEMFAERVGYDQPERYFTLGLLSMMDAVLDMPMGDVVKLLPLSAEMNAALVNHEGALGRLLEEVVEFEFGGRGTPNRNLFTSYVQALQWNAKNLHGPI